MQVDMNGVIYSLSYALDCIEAEFVGAARNHAKWVAYLSTLIGKEYGFTRDQLSDLSSCAALHDNALTQYLAEEQNAAGTDVLGVHCTLGETNVQGFPFRDDAAGFILYHHENADGSGPFKKRLPEIPVQAHIIHLADLLDVTTSLHEISAENYAKVLRYLEQERERLFSGEVIDRFLQALPAERYFALQGKEIDDLLDAELPHAAEEYPFAQVKSVMDVFGRIVDYKSPFTRNHSDRIAGRIFRMAEFYGYDRATAERLYVAGALHDIGKLAITNDILEKPDKLTDTEFAYMQNHAWYTFQLLKRISGFDDITLWASRHHEKLNGSGYPFGKKADELDEKTRLLACIDIYQALREDRPYKRGLPHQKCMDIMRDMADGGYIDAGVTQDIGRVFADDGDDVMTWPTP